MKLHTTNSKNTFIAVADDCPLEMAEVPPRREGKKSVANYQFDVLYDHPYEYTSDDVLFFVYATRNAIPKDKWEKERLKFFSKGQPCFRASPLTKRYGWGIHSDNNGKIAIYGIGTKEYANFIEDASVTKTKAMRSKKA
ncbi:DUF6157 family protein [Galbibacter pacificus]|uniref:DUF6157 family protein n=1 Tax=Galbibacter pacificus TaxID=2996052 RepID=A0ABT6FQP9_9FLAO|nr:DUF6157 family protein [Galbibacter pacificus]MDG3581976.1 DUF6157 family protein [Galbibacter pacificus]MDG3585550.1 DUF6157 family protein [Galbibacter pacificus]